ncbi:hypothetical protein [Paenibacillus spongiae]|uniref:Sporulation protein n=1 Tax=Paenibacillus spongiae TaxID=2909671 RepID=A0ABY5SA72_9BACL|nr:hypothetical protein [Paenibacillus spongiae]UVI30554.1 hypothetical protein L1F29_01295 [Paenibacillus spongiae]
MLFQRQWRAFAKHRMTKVSSLAVISLAVAIGAGACSNKGTSGNKARTESYGHDGYMGLSNSNPHLFNKNGSYLNYGEDGDFAKRKLKEIDGVANVSIMFQGPNLYATLKPAPGVDELQLRQKAISVLRYNMPRYVIHVNTAR